MEPLRRRDDFVEPRPPAGLDARTAELTTGDIIEPLWKGRYVIVALAVVFGIGGFLFNRAQRLPYEAVVVVRAVESKSSQQAEPARAENFRPLLESRTIAASLIKDFSLVAEPRFVWQSNGGLLPADGFLRNVLDVAQVTGTNLLRVSVKRNDPTVAANVANALVERAIAMNRTINQQQVVEARDYIKIQLDEAAAHLEKTRTELVAVRQRSQVEALKKDVEGALDIRGKLLELQSSIANERAYLASSEADLAKSRALLTTRRSIDREPALMETVRGQTGADPLLNLTVTGEEVNVAYAKLEEQVAGSRAKLAGLLSQMQLQVGNGAIDRAALPALKKLYEGDVAVARTEADLEIALKVYSDLALRYEQSRLLVGERGAQLQLMDPAIPPTRRMSASSATLTPLAALAGALLACGILLGRRLLNRLATG